MKNITCFTESLCGGGAEHQMVILAGMLAEKGYNVKIVTYASLPDHYDTPDNVKRVDIGSTHVKTKVIKSFVKAIKCFHYFLWHKTDCVIAYRQCANLRVLPPMFFRCKKKVKVICSDRNASTFLSFRHKILLKALYRRADYIVPNSQTETDFIVSHNQKLKHKVRTIHNYTDLTQFTAKETPCDLSVIKVVIFSRYSNQKNPLGFAKAIKKLKIRASHPFEIHWYGTQEGNINGYNKEYLAMRNFVDDLEIDDVLKLKPAVKNPSILMNNYHAVCLPSLYEGFSNSIAEGISSGKPMLVSDISDNSLMVHDSVNGFLFNPKDEDSICEAFLKFFELNYDEIVSMSHCSREIAENLFNKESFIQQYITLID